MNSKENLFCPRCGARQVEREIEGRPRQICPDCGRVDYRLPKPSAGAVIEEAGRLLLARRDIEPWKGCWYLPAGYMEVDETPAQTAEREVLEETGLEVKANALFDVYFFDDDPRGNGVLILYTASIQSGQLRGSLEGAQVRFFDAAGIPENLAGAGHDRAVQAWLAGRRVRG